jgi:NAD+ diphosphatase
MTTSASRPRDRFAPSVSQPAGAADGFLFVCRGTEVLVLEGRVPRLGDVAVGGELHYLGALDGVGCYATSHDGSEVPAHLEPSGLRGLYGLLDDDLWAIAGRAVQIVEWERTHRFCGACGTPTEPYPGQRARRCPACRHLAFPRLSPAVIMLVTRGREALLARGRRFPEPMYSCVAGFVDPGESLENAVVREVREETGIEITNVRYFGSQPWPFPHSLMIGFTAEHAGGEIAVEEEEILDAGWFAPEDLPLLPPPLSIARQLIDDWLRRAS